MPPSTDGAGPGVRLSRYLEKVWAQLGTTRGAWCRQHRIADSTVLRWGLGVEPDMRNYRAVATALDVELEQVLLIAGEIAPKKKGAGPALPEPPHICRVRTALEQDESIDAYIRDTLLVLLDRMEHKEPKRRDASARALTGRAGAAG